MTAPRPTGSIDIWNFVDNVTGTTVRKWLRDSWARRKIVALQQAVAGIVVPTASTANPAMDGTATPGSSASWSRGDHVHPKDTSKADKADTYTKSEVDGMIPTVPNASSITPSMDGTGAAGTSDDYARADHVHPADTSKQDALTSAQLAAVNSGITAETLYPTTISSLTPYSGRCTISDGGYIKIGKIVFIGVTIESNQQSGTTSSYLFTDTNADLVPMSGRAVLTVLNETAKNTVTKAAVDESGRIVVTNCAASQTLRISGCYISA